MQKWADGDGRRCNSAIVQPLTSKLRSKGTFFGGEVLPGDGGTFVGLFVSPIDFQPLLRYKAREFRAG